MDIWQRQNRGDHEVFLDIQFDQLDIETGTFSAIHKQFDMNGGLYIDLSLNEFVNRDDYLGLIHHEPDPYEWLFFESKEYGEYNLIDP